MATQAELGNVDVRLSSEDRVDGTINSCRIKLPTLGHVTRISLQEARFTNTLYNVRTGYTVQFIDIDTSTISLAVPEGSYSVYDLVGWLNTNTTLVCVYSETTMRISVSSSLPGNIQVLSNPLTSLLGFTENSALATSVTGDQAVDMSSGTSEVFIKIQELGHARHASGPLQVYTFHVPLGGRGQVSYFSESHEDSASGITFAGSGMSNLHFELVDGRGNQLDFNSEWSLILRFTVSGRSKPTRL